MNIPTPVANDAAIHLLNNIAEFKPGMPVYDIHVEGWKAKIRRLYRENKTDRTNFHIVLGMSALHQKDEQEAYNNLRSAIQLKHNSWYVHQCYLIMLFAFGRIEDVVDHILFVRDSFPMEGHSIYNWLLNTGYIDNEKLGNHLFPNVCKLAHICKRNNILLSMVKLGHLEDDHDRWFRYSFLLNEPPETTRKIQEEWHDFMIDQDINVLGDHKISISVESTDLSVKMVSDQYHY
ncbi:MAG: hypothetical protein H7833_11855 [Magnetococcus sp. DMHC-1]